jgi:hypothetical protein
MKYWLLIPGFFLLSCNLNHSTVRIEGNRFMLNGKPVWFSGINTPWHHFDDFGARFEQAWWEEEFEQYQTNHINLARVWIHCSGKFSPDITDEGLVTGASEQFWNDMDSLAAIAKEHKVYLLPCLWSFDMTDDSYPGNERYRKLVASPEKLQSYIDNFLVPLVKRYDKEDFILGWEICNEPEWMFEDPNRGRYSVAEVQRFHAMFAAAIHKNCTKPVTTGSASPKWNSVTSVGLGATAGNIWTDEALQSAFPDKDAYFDFYQIHWYPWQTEWTSSPFQRTAAEYKIDDRPVLIGESQGRGQCDSLICQTLPEMFENALANGFDGLCAWKTPQNDGAGTFQEIAKATNAFYEKHRELVKPE